MMAIMVQKAQDRDFNEIAKIYAEGFSISPYYEEWDEKSALVRVKQYAEFSDVFSIKIKNEVIGLAIGFIEKWYDGNWLRIWELVVKKEYRNKGFGKKIIRSVEDYYYKKYKIVRIILESHNKSTAFNFYKKLGYKLNNWVVLSKEVK